MEIAPNDLKLARKERGWSIEVAAELYGKYTRGRPAANATIYNLEEDFMPQDEKRRWVLARMYNLAPAALGLSIVSQQKKLMPSTRKTKSVDLKEYQKTLLSYWTRGYKGNSDAALIDLGIHINAIHEAFPYSSEKEQLNRLLYGYHIVRATVAKEEGYTRGAAYHFNKAVVLATESQYADLSAAALYHRGKFYFDRYELKKALRDFQQAESYTSAPPDVLGKVINTKGVTLARMATTEAEMSRAMRLVGLSESFVRANEQEITCMIDFPRAFYNRNYIKALLGSPVEKLHRSNEADDLIAAIYRPNDAKRFATYDQLEGLLNQATIYFDQKHHAATTTLLQDALKLISAGRLFYLPVVEKAYEALLESPYGKSKEVAELGLQLLFVQMPHLFD